MPKVIEQIEKKEEFKNEYMENLMAAAASKKKRWNNPSATQRILSFIVFFPEYIYILNYIEVDEPISNLSPKVENKMIICF